MGQTELTSLAAEAASSGGTEAVRRIGTGCMEDAMLDTATAAETAESGSLPW